MSDQIMSDQECPLGVVEKARELASAVEGRELPLSFDPADLGWDENVLRIVREYTNYEVLSDHLEEWATAAEEALDTPCEFRSSGWLSNHDIECPGCPNRWMAQQALAEAARQMARRMYRTWLARRALADSRGRSS